MISCAYTNVYIYIHTHICIYLVGGLEDFLIFANNMIYTILGMSSSQLTHIFQRARSTTNQICTYTRHRGRQDQGGSIDLGPRPQPSTPRTRAENGWQKRR